jgi:hypothetical protein
MWRHKIGAAAVVTYTQFMSSINHRERVWPTILVAGGLCWLIVTICEVLWILPVSGTVNGNAYIVSAQARSANHALDFVAAALAYRITVFFGWPEQPRARAVVIALQLVLILAMMRLAMLSLTLSAVYVDGMREMLWNDDGSSSLLNAPVMSWLGAARFALPPYLLGLAVVALVVLARRFKNNTVHMAQLSVDYANARISVLSAQLQPHFLFNSLHAISELIEESPPRATDMIARLGDFLRHALDSSKQPWIRVGREIEGLQAYLSVQRTRFRDNLDVTLEAAPETLALTMPSLLLQPLVENAIEHGRRHTATILQVRISVLCQDGRLVFRVTNSAPILSAPLPHSAFGTGLSNVHARLLAAYDNDASIAVGPGADGVTLVEVVIPALVTPPRGTAIDHDWSTA